MYALIDRDGTHGSYALVHEVHSDLRRACERAGRFGLDLAAGTLRKGERVHSADAARYRRAAEGDLVRRLEPRNIPGLDSCSRSELARMVAARA